MDGFDGDKGEIKDRGRLCRRLCLGRETRRGDAAIQGLGRGTRRGDARNQGKEQENRRERQPIFTLPPPCFERRLRIEMSDAIWYLAPHGMSCLSNQV